MFRLLLLGRYLKKIKTLLFYLFYIFLGICHLYFRYHVDRRKTIEKERQRITVIIQLLKNMLWIGVVYGYTRTMYI